MIEARELTSEYTHRAVLGRYETLTMEASDASDAISKYLRQQSDAELVSFSRPGRGAESIATVKKSDTVFLVRVYAA